MSGSEEDVSLTEKVSIRSRRRLLFGAIALVGLLVACSSVAFALGLLPFGRPHRVATKTISAVSPPPAYVETPEMLTNLDAGPHRIAFAKLQLRLEVAKPTDVALVNGAMPRIVDLAETYLRSVRPEELRSDTGTYLLREALMNRMPVAVPGATISSVLFEELLVQ